MNFFFVNKNKYGGGSYFKRKVKHAGLMRHFDKTPLGNKYYAVTKKATFFSWDKKNWWQM